MNRTRAVTGYPSREDGDLAYPVLLAVSHKKNLPEDIIIKYKP